MLGHKLLHAWRDKFDVSTTVRGSSEILEQLGIINREKVLCNVNVERVESVEKAIEKVRPNVIVNAVGIIKQLPTAKNVIKTLQINSIFPHQLAELANRYEARLIAVSTDCVFDGAKGNYAEDDISNAQDLYGKSKNLGEVAAENCLTLRTSIIGRELGTAHSLVEWFLSNRGKSVKGFVNAIYSGFPTVVLADIIADLVENHTALSGLYHVSSEPINKFDLLHLIRDAYRADIEIEKFEDFRIDRSLNSQKFRAATGFQTPVWRDLIERMAADDAIYRK